jgi:hypothetical protein
MQERTDHILEVSLSADERLVYDKLHAFAKACYGAIAMEKGGIVAKCVGWLPVCYELPLFLTHSHAHITHTHTHTL